MIDAHVHFWQYDALRDSWITEDMQAIRKNFLPSDIDTLLTEQQLSGIVAIQADQSLNETRFLLKLAKSYPKIRGVVGWIDLLSNNLDHQLQAFKKYPKIKGWRHIVQGEAPGFLSRPEFIAKVRKLHAYDYTYDILIYPSQLEEAILFVQQLPEQKLVLDHLGKPNVKNSERQQWQQQIARLAKFENLYCKLSGLVTEAAPGKWNKKILAPYFEVVFRHFGTHRILFGSDWPVLLLNARYSEWLDLVKDYIQTLSPSEQQQILGDNAKRFYNL